jgi:predicted MFS family arabinose efflux permease
MNMSSFADCLAPGDVPAGTSFLRNRALLAMFVATFAGMTGFYLLFSVVPLFAMTSGASEIGAGLVTGLLMLSTVGVELVMPLLTRWLGYRLLFAGGLFLLGAPALLLPFCANMPAILVVCLARGMGLAIIVVVGAALAAALVPAQRRGEALGLYGAISSVPAIAALPLGVWLANTLGFTPAFIAGAVTALGGLVAIFALPSRADVPQAGLGILAGIRSSALMRPAMVFLTVAMAAGIITTFLPIVFAGGSDGLAALALFAQAVTTTAARWLAGRFGDRHGQSRLVIPALVASGLGVMALVVADNSFLVLTGMLAFGAGFGGLQNASLSLMFERVSKSSYDTASALWNLAYDAGYGIGAVAFGVLAVQTGYAVAFALTAAVILAAIAPAWFDVSKR